MQRHASTPRSRSPLNARSTSSARFTLAIRPIQPTTKRSAGIAEPPPLLGARRPRRVGALLELDPEPDDGELLRRRDAERTRSSRTCGLTAISAVVTPREPALEQAERRRAQRVEVAAQDVAVEGVDDDRRPRVAGEERRDPADGAGLRRVRVQDVRPLPAGSAARARAPSAGRGAARSRARGSATRATSTPSSSATNAIESSPRAERPCDERRLVAALARARRRGTRRAAPARPC